MPGYNELAGTKSRTSVLVRGFSALEIAIQAGLVPSNTTEEQFIAFLKGEPGAASPPRAIVPIQGKPVSGELIPFFVADGETTFTSNNFWAVSRVPATASYSLGLVLYDLTVVGALSWTAGGRVATGVLSPDPLELADKTPLYIKAPLGVDATLADILASIRTGT